MLVKRPSAQRRGWSTITSSPKSPRRTGGWMCPFSPSERGTWENFRKSSASAIAAGRMRAAVSNKTAITGCSPGSWLIPSSRTMLKPIHASVATRKIVSPSEGLHAAL